MRTVPDLRAVLLRAASVALLAVSAACARTSGVVVDGAPLVRGPVVSLQHSATATGLHVAAGPSAPCGVDATADAATRYLRRTAAGALVPLGVGAAGVTSIAAGDTVEVYVDGPVAESCPVQAHAAFVVLQRLP